MKRLLKPIIRQDLRLLSRERSLPLVVTLALICVFYATWSGSVWKARQLEQLAAAQSELALALERESRQLAGLAKGELSAQQAATAGLPNTVSTALLKPPGPLAELNIGSADLRPDKADISAMGRADDMFRRYQVDNPALLAQGRFDLAFVVVYLMPLLILGLSYSVLSADRESGALGLLLAQPISPGQVAWARIAVRTAVVAGAVIGGGLLGWLAFAPEPGAPQAWPRLLIWSLLVAAYAAFWASLSALVVARNQGSDSNALILLMAWAGITLLLPAVVSMVAQTLSPTPSRMQYIAAARAAENQANAQGRELLAGYLVDHPEVEAVKDSAVAPFVKTYVLVQQRVEAAVAPISAEFNARLKAQQRLAAAMSYLSPASLTQSALAELAGSSLSRQGRFQADAHGLRQRWVEALQAPIIAGRRLTLAEFSQLPRPQFVETPIRNVTRSVLAPISLMIVYTLLGAWLSLASFRRFSLADR